MPKRQEKKRTKTGKTTLAIFGFLCYTIPGQTIGKEECFVAELKEITGQNIVTLRTRAHMTQSELGEQIRYTDKAVSRWERGEAVPDAYVLLMIADLFGVTVDYLLHEHNKDEEAETIPSLVPVEPDDEEIRAAKKKKRNRRTIEIISFLSVWTVALLVFTVLSICGNPDWRMFIYAIPLSFTVLLILNSIWGKKIYNFFFISLILWGILLSLYLILLEYNLWMLFLVGAPAQIIVAFAFRIQTGG